MSHFDQDHSDAKAERLDEIADILAAGLIRLRARKSSPLSRDRGESSLDFSPDQSGHVPPRTRWGTHE